MITGDDRGLRMPACTADVSARVSSSCFETKRRRPARPLFRVETECLDCAAFGEVCRWHAARICRLVMAPHGVSLLLLCAACSAETAAPRYFDPRGEVYVAESFTSQQAEVVIGAIDAWRDATAGGVDLKVHIGMGSPQIRPVQERDGVTGEFVASESPEIRLDTEKASNSDALRRLTLHELGHAFRLPHIRRLDSVMFPFSNDVHELDGWTLAAFRQLDAESSAASLGK